MNKEIDKKTSFRMTEAEKRSLEKFCQEFGLTQSDAIRKALGLYIKVMQERKRKGDWISKNEMKKSLTAEERELKELREKRIEKEQRKKGFENY